VNVCFGNHRIFGCTADEPDVLDRARDGAKIRFLFWPDMR
jgi:hypothetical protein